MTKVVPEKEIKNVVANISNTDTVMDNGVKQDNVMTIDRMEGGDLEVRNL